jgi:hypothetical protein
VTPIQARPSTGCTSLPSSLAPQILLRPPPLKAQARIRVKHQHRIPGSRPTIGLCPFGGFPGQGSGRLGR